MKPVENKDIVRSVLDLYAVGEIGRIANAQAGLNHSGMLDMSNAFSMSDVIDAVNYRSGDVTPVYEGLLQTYCDKIVAGEELAGSAAVERVLGEVMRFWNEHEYREYFGEIQGSELKRKKVPWIETVDMAREQALNSLQLHLNMRLLRSNGPVRELITPSTQKGYDMAAEFQDFRSTKWQEYFELRRRSQNDAHAVRLTDAEWLWHAKMLNREINERFRNMLEHICSEDAQGWSFLRAYLHTEVIKVKEHRRDERRSVANCVMRPVIEAYGWAMEQGYETVMAAVETFIRGSEETVLVKAPSRIADMPAHIECTWQNGMLSIGEGNRLQLLIAHEVSFIQLEYAAISAERKYRFEGWAGGDTEIMVLTPII